MLSGRNEGYSNLDSQRLGGQSRSDIEQYFGIRIDGCMLAILGVGEIPSG